MPELVRGLLIALAASVLTLSAHLVLMTPVDSSRAGVIPVRDAGDDRVDSVLTRLEAWLESRESQLVGTNSFAEVPSNPRAPVGSADGSDLNRQVLERLTAIERKLSVRPPVVYEMQPLERHRAPDVLAIREAIELEEVDREAFEADLHMRTMHEVVERFGYPSEASASSSHFDVYWTYKLPSANPENPNYFTLYFTDGRLVLAESRWTD